MKIIQKKKENIHFCHFPSSFFVIHWTSKPYSKDIQHTIFINISMYNPASANIQHSDAELVESLVLFFAVGFIVRKSAHPVPLK